MKIKSFGCPTSIRNYKTNNAWNIRHLVEESFVPANQQTSVLYCRLSNLQWYIYFLSGLSCLRQKSSVLYMPKWPINLFKTGSSRQTTGPKCYCTILYTLLGFQYHYCSLLHIPNAQGISDATANAVFYTVFHQGTTLITDISYHFV